MFGEVGLLDPSACFDTAQTRRLSMRRFDASPTVLILSRAEGASRRTQNGTAPLSRTGEGPGVRAYCWAARSTVKHPLQTLNSRPDRAPSSLSLLPQGEGDANGQLSSC